MSPTVIWGLASGCDYGWGGLRIIFRLLEVGSLTHCEWRPSLGWAAALYKNRKLAKHKHSSPLLSKHGWDVTSCPHFLA